MITASTDPGFEAFARDLADKAAALAEAQAQSARLARQADPARWRKAALLWPLFTKG